MNTDLVFGGVKYVALPSAIRNPHVRRAAADELVAVEKVMGKKARASEVHIIEGDDAKGFVVAESTRRVLNALDLFESSLERYADPRSAAENLERQVLLALADYDPELEPRLPDDLRHRSRTRLDALIRVDHKLVGLDIRWIGPSKGRAAVRNRVIETVERLDPWLDYLSGLLVVVGTHDEAAVQEARNHLVTAFASHLRLNVVGWMPGDDPEGLGFAVRELAS
jgi:hypothetical protein